MIAQRSMSCVGYPKVYSFNTFFYPKVAQFGRYLFHFVIISCYLLQLFLGHSAVKRWTRKVDIFGYDILVIPVHLKVHWCLATVDLRVTEKWHWLKFKIPIIKIHYRKRKSPTMIP